MNEKLSRQLVFDTLSSTYDILKIHDEQYSDTYSRAKRIFQIKNGEKSAVVIGMERL